MDNKSGRFPFLPDVSLPDTIGEAQIDIAFSGKDPSATLEQTERMFAHFVAAAQEGMFAGEKIAPDECVFRVDSHKREASGIRYRCTVRGIDPGAFRILLNVIADSCRRLEPLGEVRLQGASPGRREIGLDALLARPFPGRVRAVPFQLILREFFFENREPLIRMEFHANLRDEQFDRIKAMLEAWDQIIMFGGYVELSARDGDILPEPGELFLAEPMILEHLIYGFQGPEATFNAVINMAFTVHSSVCPIRSLEIE